MPLPLAAAGAIIGGGAILRGIGSIFGGKAEESERQERYAKYLELLHRMKREDLQAKYTRTAGQTAEARQAAMQRATAAGRGGDAEAYILPAEQGAISAGNRAIEPTLAAYRQAEIGAEQDFANRPIQPSGWDFLGEVGDAASKFGLSQVPTPNTTPAAAPPAGGEAATGSGIGMEDYGEAGLEEEGRRYNDFEAKQNRRSLKAYRLAFGD